jgi:hypothetical protein
VNTFLPYSDFDACAAALDNRRLGKQRVETLQILRTLAGETKGWRNHPAVKMWRGYERALVEYGLAMCAEWVRRGFVDRCASELRKRRKGALILPPWLGNDVLHASHRSNLLRKDPDFYSRHSWKEEPDLPYLWPL